MIGPFTGDHAFLSNASPSRVLLNDRPYATVEHAFHAARAVDYRDRAKIRQAETPAQARLMGSKVPGRSDWAEVRLAVMEDLLRQKFRDEELGRRLVATGDEDLVQVNSLNDRYWGQCKGSGENHLGLLLMKIRAELASAPRAAVR